MKRLLLTLYYLVVIFIKIYTQSGWHVQDNLPQSSIIRDMYFLNTDTGWAWGDRSLLIQTCNGGETWNPIKSLANVPWHPNIHWHTVDTAYCSSGKEEVLKTVDGGNTWIVLNDEYSSTQKIFNQIFFIDSQNGWLCGYINEVDSGFILKTLDGGISWINQEVPEIEFILDIYFVNDSLGFACGGNYMDTGIVLSTNDGGKVWDLLYTTPSLLYSLEVIDSLNIWIHGAYGLLINSNDGGINWFEQYPTNDNWISDVEFINNNEGWIIGRDSSILYTTNGGMSWIKKSYSYPKDWLGINVVSSSEAWVFGPGTIIIHTSDTGNTWSAQDVNTLNYLTDVMFYNTDIGWAVGRDGKILHTKNGGADWYTQSSNILNNFNSLSLISDSICWIAGNEGILLNTKNAGNTWEERNSETTQNINCIDFINQSKGWFAGSNGLIKSTSDGGNNWLLQQTGSNCNINSICFSDSIHGWAVSNESKIFHTNDGGEIWNTQDHPFITKNECVFSEVFFLDSNSGWVTGKVTRSYEFDMDGEVGILIKTSDAGKTWQILIDTNDQRPKFNDVFFINKDTGWVIGYEHIILNPHPELTTYVRIGTILYTEDSGNSWKMQEDLITSNTLYESVFFIDSIGWIVGGNKNSSNNGSIIHTTNYGISIDTLINTGITDNNQREKNLSYQTDYAVKSYPNPFNDYTIIQFENESNNIQSFFLYNLSGRLIIKRFNINTNQIILYRNNLPSGTYIFQLVNKNKNGTGKLIIE